MKTIGLLGGMSWESTLLYYKLLNEGVRAQKGGLHSAKIVLHSVDFAQIAKMQEKEEWEEIALLLLEAALGLERAGADMLLLCTNTIHKILPLIEPHIKTPFLHIAEATALALKEAKVDKAILLGTKFTMQESFLKDSLLKYNIKVVTPDNFDISIINDIIFNELCVGIVKNSSKEAYLNIICNLTNKHPDIGGIILGCTELGLLLNQKDIHLPLFDTTFIHANRALKEALEI